jgi:hypothetical protein
MELANARAKLGRADEHLRELRSEIQSFVETEPYRVVNVERATNLDVAVLAVRDFPPLRLGLILGDILANLRSALDNLVNELALLNGKDPGTSTSFPIFSNQADFDRRGRQRIKGLTQDQVEVIEHLQPFQNDRDPTICALATVNEYVNIDKHRAIHPTLTAFRDVRGYAESFRREGIDTHLRLDIDPVGFRRELEDGLELAHIIWRDPIPDPKPRMSAEFPIEVGFGRKGLRFEALPEIRWHINLVIECFARDFGQPIELSPLSGSAK